MNFNTLRAIMVASSIAAFFATQYAYLGNRNLADVLLASSIAANFCVLFDHMPKAKEEKEQP